MRVFLHAHVMILQGKPSQFSLCVCQGGHLWLYWNVLWTGDRCTFISPGRQWYKRVQSVTSHFEDLEIQDCRVGFLANHFIFIIFKCPHLPIIENQLHGLEFWVRESTYERTRRLPIKVTSLRLPIVLHRWAWWIVRSEIQYKEPVETICNHCLLYGKQLLLPGAKYKNNMYYCSGERNWVEAHCNNSGHTTVLQNRAIYIKIHHIHHLSLNLAAPGMFGTSFFGENVIEAATWGNCWLQQLQDLHTIKIMDVIKFGSSDQQFNEFR